MPEGTFELSSFIRVVDNRIENNNNADDEAEELVAWIEEDDDANEGEVEEIVASILAENASSNSLVLNVPLNGESDERIFNALVTSDKIKYLTIQRGVEFSSVEDMLRKAVPTMPNLCRFVMKLQVTESEATRIFTILRMSSRLFDIVVNLGDCGEGIVKPLATFLRESSSLQVLALSMKGDVSQPQAAAKTIFEGVGQSTSLRILNVCTPPAGDDLNVAAGSLCSAIENSTSLRRVGFRWNKAGNFAVEVQKALIQTESAKNFELCLRSCRQGHDYRGWKLKRDAPWRPLLSQDIPLALWPRILAKTNTWNRHESHKPLDALFFMTKEKCDILIQN